MLTQSYHLVLPHLPECQFSVARFQFTEQLNQANQLTVDVTAIQDFDLDNLVGQTVLFTITPVSGDALFSQAFSEPLRVVHGQIMTCERLSTSVDEVHYRLLIASRFTVLKQHTTSRLFQNQTVPDIIASLLRKHQYSGNDFRFTLSRTYPIREYCTQYQESDWDFIIRLCSEEGIFCYFEQSEDKDIWHFADSTSAYQRSEYTVPYRENAGLESVGREVLSEFRMMQQAADTQIRIDDYNYRTATTSLVAEYMPAHQTAVDGSLIQWGLHHKTPDEAQQQLQLLRETAECQRIQAQGQSNVVAFTPNLVFKSQPSFNESGWLIISVEHSGSRDAAYTNTFTAIPAHLPYRPKRLPHPKVAGSLNAHVVSPDNYTYAYIDDMGRYRVRLPFDLDEWSPGGDSRPVRLAKPYAGPSYGQHFPLHEGTEVMLSFVQGNPDRPYISGVMHDSKNQEHVNNEWNTRNVIRTWANNKLRMEDKQGQEHIKLATDYQKSQLNLGHIVNQTREKRGDNGEGFELRTDGWGSIRSNKGLLLTSYGQQGAQGHVLNMDETIAQLEQALALAKNLNKAAKTAQNAETSVKSQQNQLSGSLKDLRQSAIIQTAPNGIASATEQSQLHTAQENIHLISGEETDISAGSNVTVHAAQSLNLFAQTEGAKLQANQGKVSIQAQNDEMQINALKDATITSSAGKITIAAKDEILLTSGGAYIKIANGEVELGMPNIARIRCAGLAVTGKESKRVKLPQFKPNHGAFYYLEDQFGQPIINEPYTLKLSDSTEYFGRTDHEGKTLTAYSAEPQSVELIVPEQQKIQTETLYLCGSESEQLNLEFVRDQETTKE
ncbi:type VI secretion system Vgr family protein [Wielerella bovis]|uniref:type VI secretion system Vgr family protein n=1 Tax=Wielerella bovis TaxID=2917790 RepID=UPI0020189ABF|nr:type VI secretion system Vgr family protein [Wielerella bovis]ULJ63734.1 type VI secretion system tip protein VgrG [Wielerella bovis]ULJ66755.1 type VI secretion system tip protein VgrG [Wielerella bovis]